MENKDTFSICGVEGFRLESARQGSTGGQQVGLRPSTIRVYHEDLGLSASATDRNQMYARDQAIFAMGSLVEAMKLFSREDLRAEVRRFLDYSDDLSQLIEKYKKNDNDNDEDYNYEF